MVATWATPSTFDFDKLTFADKLGTTKRGGKYAEVAYEGRQLFFQLGDSPRDALRCPFGLDTPSADETDKRVVKLELAPGPHAFLNKFDEALVAAAERNSMEWFKKSTPSADHVSSIKTHNGGLPDVVKLKVQMDGERATKVFVSSWRNDKITKPVKGSLADLEKSKDHDLMLLPIVRVQGGVYFMNRTYGTSLYADQLLVIKRPVEGHHDKTFEMGDVEMTDVEDDE